jgi:hypothetical protein
MQDARVRATTDDRVIGDVRVVTPELVQDLGHDLVLAASRAHEAHGSNVRIRRDARRFAHELDLGPRLEQTHVVQQMVERDELLRRMPPPGFAAQPVHPSDDALVEVLLHAHRVVDGGPVLEEPRQDLVDISDRKRIVRPVFAGGTLRSRPAAVPHLASRIAFPDEEHVLTLLASGHEHGYGVGFVESREIVEVAVLAERVLDVTVAVSHRGRRQNHDRIAARHAHELTAAACVLLTRDASDSRLQCRGSLPSRGCSR